MSVTTHSRVVGTLIGLMAGDRNGGPIRMAVRLAESLDQRKVFDKHDIITRYYHWFLGPPHDTEKAFDTGSTFHSTFSLYRKGVSIIDAANQTWVKYKSAGVNAAHRASPLACMPTLGTMDDLIRCVREETEITHRHPQAAEVSVLSTVIIRLLIEGKSISDAIEQCSQLGKSMSFVSQIAVTGAELPKNNGGFAPDVLQACMYFVRTAEDFESGLNAALEFAGPENYCPVLVGAMLGARFGNDNIPKAYYSSATEELQARVYQVITSLALSWPQ